MPVEDHEVHPSVKIGPDHRYGCWNRPEKFKHVCSSDFSGETWKFTMSNECRFDMSLSDPSCTGCIHRVSGEEYDQMIRNIGA